MSRRRGNGQKKIARGGASQISSVSIENKVPSTYLNDLASISFGRPLGYPLPLDNVSTDPNTKKVVSTPGIMAIKFAPAVPTGEQTDDAINLAAVNLYKMVRSGQSGSTNYDKPDLMLYVLAMSQIYAMLAWGRRAYGLMFNTDYLNRYTPRDVVTAAGFDYDDLASQLAQFRAGWNLRANKLKGFCIPASIPYLTNASTWTENVYLDSDSSRGAQMYVFTPSKTWYYNQTASTTGGQLSTIVIEPECTVEEYFDILDRMIGAITGSQDAATMSGDIERKFGDTVMNVDVLTEDYTVTPIYNALALDTIHNCNAVGNLGNTDLTQAAGVLKFQPTILGSEINLLKGDMLVDIHHDDTSPVVVANALLGRTTCKNQVRTATEVWVGDVDKCGSIIVESLIVYYKTEDDLGPAFASYVGSAVTFNRGGSATNRLEDLVLISKLIDFKNAPLIVLEYFFDSTQDPAVMGLLWNRERTGIMPESVLRDLHEASFVASFIPNAF